ncbi:MAG: ribosome maturation factor RimM, partial [Oscillospiraceae bacterium]
MQKFLTVATVLKPQGIRGEIKVMPQTDSAEDMKDFSSVIIDGTSYKVLACRAAGGYAYLTLRGIPDRNAAELLRGKEVLVDRSEAPELPDDRVYIA